MPSNYEKLSVPDGSPRPDTNVAVPEKAALSSVTTACPSPDERTPRVSNVSTPQSDKSGNPFDTDIEAMGHTRSTETCMLKNTTTKKSDCQVWPGKDHWKKQAKLAKRKRGCTCLARLSPRNRIIAKVLIALLIIGIAVGVGFGISKPLHAHIWGEDKKQ